MRKMRRKWMNSIGVILFFCLAVNMLSVDDLRAVLVKADQETVGMAKHEKVVFIEGQLRECADRSNIPLVLWKW